MNSSRPASTSLVVRAFDHRPVVECALDTSAIFVQRAAVNLICMILYAMSAVAAAAALLIGYLHLVFEGMDFSHSNDLRSIILLSVIALLSAMFARALARSN